jgi:putative methionine-R-sulfoxide reductase with GAF domain
MERIKKYRRQLSQIILLSLLLTAACLILSRFPKVEYKVLFTVHILLGLLIVLAYFKVRGMYSAIKTLNNSFAESVKPENITIEQVINQQEETSSDKIQQNENRFNHLIDQFNKIDNPEELAKSFLSRMAKEFEIVQGLFYLYNPETENYEPIADYAFYGQETPQPFQLGEGLNGQVARDKKTLYLSELPRNYRQVISGLGKREPKYLTIIPVIAGEKTVAVVEMALFNNLETNPLMMLEKILNNLSTHFEK